jgi:hypothetical protein
VDIETLLRKLPLGALSLNAQEAVDELFSKADPLTPEQRKRFVKAADRALRVRREILNLAAFASGHRPHAPSKRTCRECRESWPCPDVLRAAGPTLDAVAELKA